ncbi:hypothetical protein [Burkholderia sp. BCC0405]|uniref:hypothetical protein n=1 Tax=Burkholderia sp. BCC0405 TaxID=2676298 RepID=UPI00158B0D2B|nr:hypothetical protein [Burkholderia sp. BCC0405]
MKDQRPEVDVDGECLQVSKQRYTAVWIVVCLVLLQSGFAMIHFLTWLLHSYGRWSVIFGSPSRVALWSTTIVWSMVSLVSAVMLSFGRRLGRGVYTWGAILWTLATFMLAPWPLALSGTISPLLILSILYGRSTREYLENGAVLLRNIHATRRSTITAALWAFTTAYYYAVFLLQLTNKGWLAQVTNGPQRLWVVIAMVVVPLIAVFTTGSGEQQWRLGIFLLVSGLAAFFVLLGYVPYSRTLVGTLGPGYVGYAVPWAGATTWVGILLLFGSTLTFVFRPRQQNTRADRWAID